jgi:hypothetical protein
LRLERVGRLRRGRRHPADAGRTTSSGFARQPRGA